MKGWSSKFLGAIGKKMLIRTVALHLSEVTGPHECVAWTHEESTADGLTFFVYLVLDQSSDSARVLKRIDEHLDFEMPTPSLLPGDALPVLKRTKDGSLLRLWPPPGPKGPESQKISIDWGTFVMSNRVFEIR
jgi:hypothetical protein